jgi:uncharacterized protein (DUF1330 family)
MTKAYWIVHATVDDPKIYTKYREANAVAFAKFHGRFLVRGGVQDLKEGALRPRSVILEFPSLEAAQACYYSPEYQRAKDVRGPVSHIDLVIVEGYDA